MGGVEKGGGRKVFLYRKPRPSRLEALLKGSRNFSGGCVLWYIFLPPYVLHPPYYGPRIAVCATCYRIRNGETQKMAGESAGKIRSAGGSAALEDGRFLSGTRGAKETRNGNRTVQ